MRRTRWAALLLALLLALTLPSCGRSGGESSASMPDESSVSAFVPEPEPEPKPEPEPVLPYTNPLTGEGCAEEIGQNRPVAVMLNNIQKALPQLGVSQADIIYEAVAEGGITRMLGVFQSVDGVGEIGSVRSARDYYVSLAYGHDAIFLHAGGSPMAYEVIKSWGVTALDCVNGPYEGSLFWRDTNRKKTMGREHSVLTSGAKIQELLPTYKKVTLTHREGYTQPLTFLAQGEKASGSPASQVSVTFSHYKTGVFTYDPASGLYRIEEYGAPYVDGNTGEQVAVKNVLVLYTDVSSVQGDDKGRQAVRTTGSGSGLFFCDGTVQEITWSKAKHSAPLSYTTANGQPLKLGVGKSYVNLVSGPSAVTVS